MLKFLSLIFLCSTSAFACPDLSGTYAIPGDGQQEVTLVQSASENVTTLQLQMPENVQGPRTFSADLQWHHHENELQILSWCEGNKFQILLKSQDRTRFDGRLTLSNDADGNLLMAVLGTIDDSPTLSDETHVLKRLR
jgi:hypothetical protein